MARYTRKGIRDPQYDYPLRYIIQPVEGNRFDIIPYKGSKGDPGAAPIDGDNMEDIEDGLVSLDNDLASAESRIENHEGRLTQAEADIVAVENRVYNEELVSTDHELRITAAEDTIVDHEERIGSLEPQVANHETRLDVIEPQVANHETRLDTIEPQVDNHEIRMDVAESNIYSHETRLDYIEGDYLQSEDYNELSAEDEALSNRIDTKQDITDQALGTVDKTIVGAINETISIVDVHESRLDLHDNQITSIVASAELLSQWNNAAGQSLVAGAHYIPLHDYIQEVNGYNPLLLDYLSGSTTHTIVLHELGTYTFDFWMDLSHTNSSDATMTITAFEDDVLFRTLVDTIPGSSQEVHSFNHTVTYSKIEEGDTYIRFSYNPQSSATKVYSWGLRTLLMGSSGTASVYVDTDHVTGINHTNDSFNAVPQTFINDTLHNANAGKVNKAGDTMTGDLNMGNQSINNVETLNMSGGYLNIGTFNDTTYGTGNAQFYYDGVNKKLQLQAKDASNVGTSIKLDSSHGFSVSGKEVYHEGNLDLTDYAPFVHTHVTANITDLQPKLDAKLNKAGDTMTGVLNMGNFDIKGANAVWVSDPGSKEGYVLAGGNGWVMSECPDDLSNATGDLQFMMTNTADFSGTPVRKATVRESGLVWAAGGFDANSKVITGVANGTNSNHAVNKAQLDTKVTFHPRIPAGTDLNTLTTPGMYYSPANADACTNVPIANTAFSLFVEQHAGVKQTWTEFVASAGIKTFVRNYYSNVWTPWELIPTEKTLTVDGNPISGGNVESDKFNLGFDAVGITKTTADAWTSVEDGITEVVTAVRAKVPAGYPYRVTEYLGSGTNNYGKLARLFSDKLTSLANWAGTEGSDEEYYITIESFSFGSGYGDGHVITFRNNNAASGVGSKYYTVGYNFASTSIDWYHMTNELGEYGDAWANGIYGLLSQTAQKAYLNDGQVINSSFPAFAHVDSVVYYFSDYDTDTSDKVMAQYFTHRIDDNTITNTDGSDYDIHTSGAYDALCWIPADTSGYNPMATKYFAHKVDYTTNKVITTGLYNVVSGSADADVVLCDVNVMGRFVPADPSTRTPDGMHEITPEEQAAIDQRRKEVAARLTARTEETLRREEEYQMMRTRINELLAKENNE